MERLTHERVNGIKTGYWSAATKEALVQKLAAYENTGYEPDEIRAALGWLPSSAIPHRERPSRRSKRRRHGAPCARKIRRKKHE